MTYASEIQVLMCADRLMPLAFGRPLSGVEKTLRQPLDTLFGPAQIVDRDAAQACLAGLWLYVDYFVESHAISQDLETAEGSYWHAILHRREPDYGNAKYWFRHLGRHPAFEDLRRGAAELVQAAGTPQELAFIAGQLTWDPFAFVDACEAAGRGKADEMLCRRIQRREWELLFEYCYRRAVGK